MRAFYNCVVATTQTYLNLRARLKQLCNKNCVSEEVLTVRYYHRKLLKNCL